MTARISPHEQPQHEASCCGAQAADPGRPAAGRPAGEAAERQDAELSPAVHAFLKALASPARQRVMLLFTGGAELSVGEVAERAGLTQPRTSEHLAELRRGGILASRKDGKTVLYRADTQASTAALAELQDFLRSCC